MSDAFGFKYGIQPSGRLIIDFGTDCICDDSTEFAPVSIEIAMEVAEKHHEAVAKAIKEDGMAEVNVAWNNAKLARGWE